MAIYNKGHYSCTQIRKQLQFDGLGALMDAIISKSFNHIEFAVGQKILRAITSGRTALLEQRTVSRIENGKLYLDDSKVAIIYPNRLWILY